MSEASLSPDQIAELIAANDRGDLGGELPARSRRAKRVRPVDFTRPIKFTPEQVRRVKQAMDRFCQAAGTSLTAELRTPVEIELIDSVQLTWWDAQLPLAKDSINSLVQLKEVGTSWLVSGELSFFLAAIENLLGGSIDRVPRTRRLSDIDRRLARRVMETMVQQLSSPWFDLARTQLELSEFDAQFDNQLVSASEPTLVLVLEVRLGPGSHTLSFLLPYSAIQPVESVIGGREGGAGAADDPRVTEAVTDVLGDIEVVVRAAAPPIEMPVEDVLALRPGDVLHLNTPISEGVTLFADDQPVHRAVPGRNGQRRAVQVLGPAEDRR